MNTINKLLDKARDVCSSDSQIAARLKVTRSAVSKWRHGGKIEAKHLAALIEMTNQDPALVVQVMQEQEAPAAERRMWSAVWDRLSPVTTVIGVCVLAMNTLPGREAINTLTNQADAWRMYIMSLKGAGITGRMRRSKHPEPPTRSLRYA